jgi:hypothetical protein
MGLNHALTVNPMVRSYPPNGLRISRAAPSDRDGVWVDDTT